MSIPSADFSLDSSLFVDRGFTATRGATVTLALQNTLGAATQTARVRLSKKTKGATGIPELATEVFLSPPTAELELTIPDEVSSWEIEVQINGGKNTAAQVIPGWTRTRIISTLSAAGNRKWLAAETDGFDPTFGWVGSQNDSVDNEENLGGGGGPDAFAGLDVESEHRADVGVEYGSSVSRWVDQRSYKHFVTFERDLALWYALGVNDEGVMTGTPSGGVRKGLGYTAEYDADGPAITPPGGLWSRSPLVLNAEEFTIALRIRLASSDGQSILTICAPFPSGADDAPKLVLRWTYAAGPSGQLEIDITDAALNTTTAVASMTHGAWHNVIIRHIPGVPDPLGDRTMVIRVDGVNGTPQSTATITDDLVPLDATSLGCDLEATNGTSPGSMAGGTAIRQILAAPRAWSDAECLTAEAALTAAWT